MCTEFYKLATDEPTYTKLVLHALEWRGQITAADNLYKPLKDLERHQRMELMKEVATQSARAATKRAKGKGGAAGDN